MWEVFTDVANNVNMGLENIIVLILVLASLIFFAKDFKLGSIALFFTSGLAFMVFYAYNLYYVSSLVIMLIALVIMALSFIAVRNTSTQRGYV